MSRKSVHSYTSAATSNGTLLGALSFLVQGALPLNRSVYRHAADLKNCPMSRATQNRAHEGGWRVDRANATNLLAMLVLRQHGKPAVPGSYVDLDGPETEEFGRLFSRTTQKTAGLAAAMRFAGQFSWKPKPPEGMNGCSYT